MRSVLATKREIDMTERKLLFLMNAEQAQEFARLVRAAEAGDGGAACRLGDLYREGRGGLRYSPKETHRWYARSAMTGDANGQNNLGACYEHGIGCRQSYARAVKWYRLAAAQKLGTASMNLGYCYLYGHGVPLDKTEALRLFRLAVKQGEPKAADELVRLGEPVGEPSAESSVQFRDVTEPGAHLGIVGGQARASGSEAEQPAGNVDRADRDDR
jgi:TPR repeat protein